MRRFWRELRCWHVWFITDKGYVGDIIEECCKCGKRRITHL